MSESIVRFERPENRSWILNEKYDRWNENVPKISTRHLAINTEFLLPFYKSTCNSQMRVFWSHYRALQSGSYVQSGVLTWNRS